jgi:hypothetical protein
MQRRNIELQFIDSLEIFRDLDRYNKMNIIDGLESRKFFKGECILREGD